MARILELSKKAGVAGLILISLPVLVPCLMALAFAGALLALPVGSAAVGFIACKKLVAGSQSQVRRLRSSTGECYQEGKQQQQRLTDHDQASVEGNQHHALSKEDESGSSADGISAEEAPEKEPVKVSDDFIVVEKPCDSKTPEFSQEREEQCKTAPDYFQCVEAEEAKDAAAAAAGDGVGADHGEQGKEDLVKEDEYPPKAKGDEVDGNESSFVEVDESSEAEKNEGVGSVILDDARKNNQDSHVQKAEPVQKNGTSSAAAAAAPEQERSSVDEYVSLAEDFPSSDESVASSRNSCSKSGATDKEKRVRLRKELVLVKRVVGCNDTAGGTLSDQVERLYAFLGVELPSSYQHTTDYDKLLEAMNVLKAVVGVK